MKRKNISFLVPLVLGGILLTSCGDGDKNFVNPLEEINFFNSYYYSQNAGADEIVANLTNEDPGSYDDTINLERFTFLGEESLPLITKDKVVIPSLLREDVAKTNGGFKVVSLGDGFMEGQQRKEVVIPKTVERIGKNAFLDTPNLASLNISELKSIKYVGDNAFLNNAWYNTYYESHEEGPVIFGETIYDYKGKVTNYEVPSNIKYIAANAFKGHSELTSITFHDGVREIGESAFEGTGLVDVNIPSSTYLLGDKAFASSPIKSIKFNKGEEEKQYGKNILEGCNVLETLVYDGNVTLTDLGLVSDKLVSLSLTGEKIVANALAPAVNLKSLDLKGVKYISSGNFDTLTSLETLTNSDEVEYIEGDGLSQTKYYSLLTDGPVYIGKYLDGFKGDIVETTLPNDITGIGDNAMKGYSFALASLPASLKYIGKEAFANVSSLREVVLPNSIRIESKAFNGCRGIQRIDVNDYTVLEKLAFNNCVNATTLALPFADDISELFGDYIDVVSYTFKRGPKAIVNQMFEKTYTLEEVVLSDTIEEVGVKAFRRCKALKKIHFPSSVRFVKTFAFQECKALESVTYDVKQSVNPINNKVIYEGVRDIGPFCFDQCEKLSGTFELPKSIRKVNGCILSRTNVTKIKVYMLDYYLEEVVGVESMNIVTDQHWVDFSNDWNVDYVRQYENGNPYRIPYELEIVPTK